MSSPVVAPIRIAELEADPHMAALTERYARESAIDGMPPINPQWAMYHHLEQVGALFAYGVRIDGELVGFATVLVSLNAHYGVPLATTESLYVDDAHRGSGAGFLLLRAVIDCATERGASAMLMSAPVGGQLDGVLTASRAWRETNRVFFRRVAA